MIYKVTILVHQVTILVHQVTILVHQETILVHQVTILFHQVTLLIYQVTMLIYISTKLVYKVTMLIHKPILAHILIYIDWSVAQWFVAECRLAKSNYLYFYFRNDDQLLQNRIFPFGSKQAKRYNLTLNSGNRAQEIDAGRYYFGGQCTSLIPNQTSQSLK